MAAQGYQSSIHITVISDSQRDAAQSFSESSFPFRSISYLNGIKTQSLSPYSCVNLVMASMTVAVLNVINAGISEKSLTIDNGRITLRTFEIIACSVIAFP